MEVQVRFEGRPYTLEAIAGDHITQVMIESREFYEANLLAAIKEHAGAGIYLDVGAFIGTHTVFFAEECPSDLVLAFEPDERAYAALVGNANRYRATRILAIRAAVHDRWTSVRTTETPGNRGMSRCLEGGPVAAIGIDEFLDNPITRGPVALLKVDVEGAELNVLRSAARTITTWRPVIVAEAHDKERLDMLDRYLAGYELEGCYGKTPTYLWTSKSTS